MKDYPENYEQLYRIDGEKKSTVENSFPDNRSPPYHYEKELITRRNHEKEYVCLKDD
jgi:hypothetical protein